MAKPATLDGYSDQYTVDCERVLVTLLRGLGPWKDSVYLVGGLILMSVQVEINNPRPSRQTEQILSILR